MVAAPAQGYQEEASQIGPRKSSDEVMMDYRLAEASRRKTVRFLLLNLKWLLAGVDHKLKDNAYFGFSRVLYPESSLM